ncbi:serine/threonine/tyrosine-interacting protein B-like isoform X2 [Clavelina lepadiformis]|uniref:serine/threonine/tyrosine-interacting protein B-like isoform X2 n=1 Tax=Clavelina lepadiformis TaxID=159417 RepID=UPI00404142F5
MELDTSCKTDWTYSMRRDMQMIIPGLYLGPFSAATKSKCQQLHDNGITHIICLRHQLEARFIRPNFPESFKYLVIDVADNPCENIMQYFTRSNAFIDECFSVGGKVLVHGNGGISRSATIVIAFIMIHYNSTFEAFELVQGQRFCIKPNMGFLAQLKEYEPIYQAKCMALEKEQPTSYHSGKKRSIEDIES